MHNGCTPTDSGEVRGRDRFGQGAYGVSRDGGARVHAGADFVTTPGESIQAPIDGVVTRVVYPYANTRELSGLEVTNQATGVSVKIFYASASDGIVGQQVRAGDVIGTAQDLQSRYPRITNHVHVEVRFSGTVTDPVAFIRGGGP